MYFSVSKNLQETGLFYKAYGGVQLMKWTNWYAGKILLRNQSFSTPRSDDIRIFIESATDKVVITK